MKIYMIVLVLFLLVLTGCSNVKKITINDTVILAEVADEPDEWAKGLMYRTSLDENKGMLFVFEEENFYVFWMKNTLIPLDMIWIGDDKTIVDITTAEPCEKEPCQEYTPEEIAQYVLEVNKGFAEKNGIKVGDKVNF